MGYYIQTPGHHHGKAARIARDHQGTLLQSPPKYFVDIPEDKALVCVVDNGPFEAAALAYDQGEFECFTDPNDSRPQSYVLLDKQKAYELAGYKPERPDED